MFKSLPKFNEQSYAHYVTTKTFENSKYFQDRECCGILLEELDFYRKKMGFKVLGYVIMPDHWHCLIWWDIEKYPALTISKIVQGIKSHSAKEISYFLETGRRKPSLSPYSKGASEGSHLPNPYQSEGSHLPSDYQWVDTGEVHTKPHTQIWQPGFYDFNVYTDSKLHEKLNYIHDNPRRAGLCQDLADYPWSSYKQCFEINDNLSRHQEDHEIGFFGAGCSPQRGSIF